MVGAGDAPMTRTHDTPKTEGSTMTRGEQFGVAAIALNLATLIFGGGAFYQTVQDHDRRIVAVEAADKAREAQSTQILIRLERIDSNTIALKERLDKDHHE